MRRSRREFIARAARVVFQVYVKKKPPKAVASTEHITPQWSRRIIQRFVKTL